MDFGGTGGGWRPDHPLVNELIWEVDRAVKCAGRDNGKYDTIIRHILSKHIAPPTQPVGLEEWIALNFGGRGVAMRETSDPPIPGEPFMSMNDAKRLVRQAVITFAASTPVEDRTIR